MFDWKSLELVELPVINKSETTVTKVNKSLTFYGEVWCITGAFDRFRPRSKAEDIIKKYGGRISSNVTGKVTHLLHSNDHNNYSSKSYAANNHLHIIKISEKQFIARLVRNGIDF